MTFFRILVFLTFCYMARADFREEALRLHNTYREIHDAPPMTLNRAMNRGADQYARKLFDSFCGTNNLEHSAKNTRPGQGENLASGWTTARGSGVVGRTIESAMKGWYDEVCQYNFNRHAYQSGLGHFSQLVWKDSTELGIGRYTGKKGRRTCTYIVARYKDAGNVNSQEYFRNNVSKGNFNKSQHCRRGGDQSVGEAEYVDVPEGSGKEAAASSL